MQIPSSTNAPESSRLAPQNNHKNISLIVHIAITAIGVFLVLVIIPAKQMSMPLPFKAEMAVLGTGSALLFAEGCYLFASSFFCKKPTAPVKETKRHEMIPGEFKLESPLWDATVSKGASLENLKQTLLQEKILISQADAEAPFSVLSITEEEFLKIEKSKGDNCFEASAKNRRAQCLPYKENVPFTVVGGENTYINASMVTDQLIASQGPNEKSRADFIALLFKHKIDVVIMLTDLYIPDGSRELCTKYWPDLDETFGTAALSIKNTEEINKIASNTCKFATTTRSFTITSGAQTHNVTQIQTCDWIDKKEAPEGLLEEFNKLMQGKTLVHCSAGVGRTGTFVATHLIVKLKEDMKGFQLDLGKFIEFLRSSKQFGRAGFIETKDQFHSVCDYLKSLGIIKE